ncbi:MAG: SAM-dependent chlorinase/fluorinase [Bacteroidia bacterium]|nr:SAM-dependent chlorinase/fluorinase [Bacteroidia bacterium]
MSDYGSDAIENTIYHALLIQHFPHAHFIFSNQQFRQGDIISPGIFMRLAYKDFPADTIHICLLHIESRSPEKYTVAKAANQYFIGPDNGFLPIALENEAVEYYKLPASGAKDLFRDIFIPAALRIVQEDAAVFAISEESPKKFLMPSPAITGNTYRLSVLYNDSHGNAYLNMTKSEFDRITQGKKFSLKIGYNDHIDRISEAYHDHSEGDKLALFGLGDMLQISINCGSAAQYLGLKYNKMVMLEIVAA